MLNRREFIAISAIAASVPDWVIAQDTSFDLELAKALENAQFLAEASGQDELKELLAEGSVTVSTSSAPKSKTQISARAISLIKYTEVTSEKNYNNKLKGVIWPKEQSGLTIACGYDIGYVTPGKLTADWKDYISADVIQRLSAGCGKKGDDARRLLPLMTGIEIPWDVAERQFEREVLPSYIYETENALPNADQLSKNQLGALVSLVYNRGASFTLKGKDLDAQGRDRYLEMRNIKQHMRDKKFDLIPAEIIAMKRIWEGKNVPGLLIRRQLEADLFRTA